HQAWKSGAFQKIETSRFAQELYYLVADMNSHPLHLAMTLKSLVERWENTAGERTLTLRKISGLWAPFAIYSGRDEHKNGQFAASLHTL
ncbi:MAG: hypothetical protein N2578_09725, partial [Bdellovibrionaceae bacterium]|nr:hypothetical protein [Pseudobdellovibrionaceae bacterium]